MKKEEKRKEAEKRDDNQEIEEDLLAIKVASPEKDNESAAPSVSSRVVSAEIFPPANEFPPRTPTTTTAVSVSSSQTSSTSASTSAVRFSFFNPFPPASEFPPPTLRVAPPPPATPELAPAASAAASVPTAAAVVEEPAAGLSAAAAASAFPPASDFPPSSSGAAARRSPRNEIPLTVRIPPPNELVPPLKTSPLRTPPAANEVSVVKISAWNTPKLQRARFGRPT
ncbi:mucin-7-like [Macrobrachium nipponense]|uniref:mucin-7-like n=1 Tax=Macrobrachium nipponense TaxID=159736 RepID=UPI0030C805FA